jgi:hypothetical protein
MSRGFAGGLADGLNQGMQMYALHKSIESRDKADERADASAAREEEAHAQKMKEAADVRNMTAQWAQTLGWKPPQATGGPMRANAPSFGAPGQMPDTPSSIGLGGAAPIAATPSADALQPAAPVQQQQEPPMSPGEYIQKQVWSGDAFSDPEKLNKMAAIAFANNQGPMGIQFLNQVHTATKNGWTKALGSLVSGDTKGATEILKKNGMDIRGEMTPVEGKEHTYKVNIGGKEQEISAQTLFMSGNPEEAYKMQATAREKAAERELKEKEFKLKERSQENEDRKTTAEIGKTKAEIGLIGERGALARAKAREADRKPAAGLKSSPSSSKEIGTAISRRDTQFKQLATVRDEDGEERVDGDLLREFDDAATTLQTVLEEERGEELDARTMHKVTDEVRRMNLAKWTPEQRQAGMQRALRRFKLDGSEEEATEKKDPKALSDKPAEKPKAAAAAPLKKEPTREEKEVDALSKHNEYPTRIADLKKLQKERYAENLTAKEKAEVEKKIRDIIGK